MMSRENRKIPNDRGCGNLHEADLVVVDHMTNASGILRQGDTDRTPAAQESMDVCFRDNPSWRTASISRFREGDGCHGIAEDVVGPGELSEGRY
jgi:hypothetical protein